MKMGKNRWKGLLAVLGCWWSWSGVAHADARHFGYSYEADSVLEKGRWEFEQWITNRVGKGSGNFSAFDLREEIEYGLADRLTSALYLNFRNTHREGIVGTTDTDAMEFRGISSEWKYMALSPNLNPVGLLLYLEPAYTGSSVSVEGKIVLQHNFGEKLIWATNLTVEPDWAFHPAGTEKELELEATTGLAWRFIPHWSTGLEVRGRKDLPDFGDSEPLALFVGPNLHWEGGQGWATLTALPQVPIRSAGLDLDARERVEVRLIAGILF